MAMTVAEDLRALASAIRDQLKRADANDPRHQWLQLTPEQQDELIDSRLGTDLHSLAKIHEYDLATPGAFAAEMLRGARRPIESPPGGARLVRLDDVLPERVCWLWAGRIPRGKLTILDGDPGLGKSTIMIDLAARVSRGLPMPREAESLVEPGGVVLLSAEDGLGDTIRPRLDAAGADSSRVVALTAIATEDGTERLPRLPLDVGRLEAAIKEYGAKLVVVDVLMAYLSADVNAHRDQDVRSALAQLAAAAERTGAAIVVLRHLNKSPGGPAVYRGGGSIGIVGAAPSALVVGRDPDDESRLVLAVTKANLAALAPSLAYRIVDRNGTGAIEWEGVTTHTAAQLLAVPTNTDERSALDEAKAVLRDILGDGAVRAKEVERQAREAGVSEKTLRRAKEALGVKSIRPDGFTGPWAWTLPATVHAQGTAYMGNPGNGHVHDELGMYTDMPTEDDLPASAFWTD
jgi:hypothetical protein